MARILNNLGLKASTLVVRERDGKEFRVKNLGLLSLIEAADGETDQVKWAGRGYASPTTRAGYSGYEETP